MNARLPAITGNGSQTIVAQGASSSGNSSPTDQACLRNPCNMVSSAYHSVLGRLRRTHVNEHVNGLMLESKAIYNKDYFIVRQETWEFPEGRKIYARKCHKNREAEKKLRREKKMLRAAQGPCPYIVSFIETKDKNLLMPYAGKTLHDILKRDPGRGLPIHEFRHCVKQLIQGVAHLHRFGIWHLDLKPLNLLMDDNDKLTIIDFGHSQHAGRARRDYLCTEGYKPPEMFYRGPKTISEKTDIFSAGAVFFELLMNKQLFDQVHSFFEPSVRFMMNKDSYYEYLDDRLKGVEAIDKGYAELIRSMLAWNPEHRPCAQYVLTYCMNS
ncbi:protein kinase domain-containing protein [Endozoicomonas sp. 2B-B]